MYELYVVFGFDYDRLHYIADFETAQQAYDHYFKELVPRYKSQGRYDSRFYIAATDGSHYFDNHIERHNRDFFD